MVFFGKIVAAFFAWGTYVVLRLAGWKRKTVMANAKHVASPVNYDELLFNLTRHAGELLF
jgi:KDO2-lipid IV(A) lauroyltransferase